MAARIDQKEGAGGGSQATCREEAGSMLMQMAQGTAPLNCNLGWGQAVLAHWGLSHPCPP